MSRRTLVIGLGSTGSEMVDILLRELYAIDGSLDSFPHVHAVKIDTAKVSPKYVDGHQVRVIQMHDHIPAESNLTWEGYLTRNEYNTRDWLTQGACARMRDLDFSKGAGSYRPAGQFGMVMAARAISEELSLVIRNLGLVSAVTSQELVVYVLGFSGGGTCSGGLVTLLEAVQHSVTSCAQEATVSVLLSIPRIDFEPLMLHQSVYIPNTVGLLQSLSDARSIPSYRSLASTYELGLLPNGTRSLVYNKNWNQLAHLVSIVQPANADNPSSATQSVVDAVMAQILGSSDEIGHALVRSRTQSEKLNILTTRRATYPRQEIAEGLLATALEQAMIIWAGRSEVSTNIVHITESILKVSDHGKHFGDIFGIIRIAIDSLIMGYRLRIRSDNFRSTRASDYRLFIGYITSVNNDFSNDLDAKFHDTTEPVEEVITELIRRLRSSLTNYPKVGFSNLLRQAIHSIEQVLDSPVPTVSYDKLSLAEIAEIATDFSMQLNPVYRESSYRAATQEYLFRLNDELRDRAVAYLLGIDDFIPRFRLHLRRDLTELRIRLDGGSIGLQSPQDGAQVASVATVVSRLQDWIDNAKQAYATLGRPNPSLILQVDRQRLQRLQESTNLADLYRVKLLDDLMDYLTTQRPIVSDEVDRVLASIIEPKVHYLRDNPVSLVQPGSLDLLLNSLGNPRTKEVPFIPTQETDIRTFRFTASLSSGGCISIPTTAESVIELTFATDIPLDNLLAFTLSNTWADALKGIRGDSPDYDRYRTIYPSNQLGLSEAVKAVSQFPDTRQNDRPDNNSQDPENRDTHRISSTTSIATEKSIFISYRREDSRDTVGRMYDRLSAHYGVARVIRDIDSLPIGRSFPEALDEAVSKAAITLVIIGPNWASICDDSGVSRLANSEDFVRREVVRAMASGKPVVPVLVSEAKMPKRQDIPEPLHKLLDQHGIHVRPDPDFHKDMDSLIRSLNRILI